MILNKYTLFTTPVISGVIRVCAFAFLLLTGWRCKKDPPKCRKYVLIAAPHTSNWDFVYTLCVAIVLKVHVRLMGKKEILDWPLGFTFKWMGLIPVDRSRSTNLVQQTAQTFRENEEMVIVIPPSGTRNKVKRWKTGFYYTALLADVPIGLGFLDYKRRIGGIGPLVFPTGDIDADMEIIRFFYRDIQGKYPEKAIRYKDEQKEE